MLGRYYTRSKLNKCFHFLVQNRSCYVLVPDLTVSIILPALILFLSQKIRVPVEFAKIPFIFLKKTSAPPTQTLSSYCGALWSVPTWRGRRSHYRLSECCDRRGGSLSSDRLFVPNPLLPRSHGFQLLVLIVRI